ncbi:hypothetical protein WK77_16765 [Burkholderia ubonensis]|nr:hypothetical protein WK77_16765 [Burkholderia ubonensis]
MLSAGRQTLEMVTKEGPTEFTVDVADLDDGEFTLHFFRHGAVGVGRAKIRLVKGRRVWVNHIEVNESYRRRGYASAFVQWVVDVCGHQLVPVNERGDGPVFWAALRCDARFSGWVESGISETTYAVAMRQLGLLD